MATVRQKKLAKAIIENAAAAKPKNKKELLVSAGYDLTTAQATPSRIMEQKGVIEAIEDFGFTEDNAKKVVASILLDEKKEPNARLKASDMVFKIHGSYAPDRHVNLNVNTDVETEELVKLAKQINEQRRHTRTSIPSNGVTADAVDTEIQN